MMLKFAILATLISLYAYAQDSHIRFVIEFLQHGARASDFPVFNTTNNISDINHKRGELTNVGLRQQYLLGRTVRERYIHKTSILHEKFRDAQLTVKSAPYNAAMMSAYAFLTGLFTPGTGEVLTEMAQAQAMPPVEDTTVLDNEVKGLMDKGLPYYTQTFPIHTLESDGDLVLSGIQECDILKYIIFNNTASAEVKALENEKYGEFFKGLSKMVNHNITNLTTAYLLFDDIVSDKNDDFNLNFNLSPENMSDLSNAAKDFWRYVVFGNETVMMAVVTELYREWIVLLNNVVHQDNTNVPSYRRNTLAVYSGDSSQFVPILYTIGSAFGGPIDFSENIMIQMSRRVGLEKKLNAELRDYDINIFRNGVIVNQRGEPTIDAMTFVNMLARNSLIHLTRGEFKEWCGALPVNPPTPPTPVNPSVSKVWNIVAIILEVVFLAIIIVTCFFVNRRKSTENTTHEEEEKLNTKEEKTEPKKESVAQEL